MNKVTKIISILLIAVMLVVAFQGIVSADASSIVGGITPSEPTETSGLTDMAGRVLGIIQVVTAVLAVILIAVFGFKFVLGSAQEKADYQKSFIPLIVGVVVVFAATSIAKMIFSIIK